MPRSTSGSRLEVSPDVTAVMRPEEMAYLQSLHGSSHARCRVCRRPVHSGNGDVASIALTLDDAGVEVEIAHAACAPSRANLTALVVEAQADPLGIRFAQALHPDAGPVLLWERTLALTLRDGAAHHPLYLDHERWAGFHHALADEPVRLLTRWRLVADANDLVLRHAEEEIERFHDALARAPQRWAQTLGDTGFCLLIAGAGIGLDHPSTASIQRAIRDRRALMGMVEYEL